MIKDCHVGVKGVVCVAGKCLILKKGSAQDGYWDLPGGRIDGSESLEETLRRELKEELPTLSAYKIGNLLSAYRLSKNIESGKALVLVFYRVEAEGFEVRISSEHMGYKWVSANNCAELLTSDFKIESGYYDAISRALGSAD